MPVMVSIKPEKRFTSILLRPSSAMEKQAHVKSLDENDAALVKKVGQDVVRAKI